MKVSIKYKILSSFSVLIFLSLFILIYFTNTMINKNNEYVIRKEIVDIKKHSDIYLNQLFLTQNNNALDFLNKNNKEIVDELSYKIENRTILYSVDGKVLRDSSENNGEICGSNEDLIKAIKKEIAYTINHDKDKVIVKFSYPIKLNNQTVGIIRYVIDYSDLYKWGRDFINMIIIFSAILFLITLGISFVISHGITKPIKKLTDLTKTMAKGNLNIDMNIKSKDEIGELFENFCTMTDKIRDQIDRIQRDTNAIKALESHRKVFFDNVTHELKTPLTTILGYAEVIEENGFNNDEEFFEKGINHIITESMRLKNMVVDLIEFSNIKNRNIEDEFEDVNLSELISNTCDEMKMKAMRYNIKIIADIESNINIIGSRDKLKQVFINIIDNSIKYSFENTKIDVSVVRNNEKIEITIIDEGQGILQDKIKNIFEPFYRSDKVKCKERGSSGLGLAICKEIIEKHGGYIFIKSEVNRGTEVKIVI